ncbi:MAG TPA: polyprenyl synthetase [Chloroflexi bacterium]|nr:polyprenyl synthetase [Chloroflexota bacterium]
MRTSPLADLQSRYGSQLDARIQKWLAWPEDSSDFAGMMRYQLGYADETLKPTLAPSGKRFRPLLCLLACEALGCRGEQALDTAVSVELLHNFSLVHDDIQDRDPSRRHRPTVWKLWGEPQGINVGDGLFALASRAVMAIADAETAVAVGKAFQETALLLTLGQFLDMSFESRASVAIDEYIDMISRKTAALVGFCVWSGARIGGMDEAFLGHLRDFGRWLGIAYQIHDDIMGIWGSAEETGKLPGTDLRNCKKTLPVLLAAQRARGGDERTFEAYFAGAAVDLDLVRETLDRLDARSDTEDVVETNLESALSALQRSGLDGEFIENLQSVAFELTGQAPAKSSGTVSNR